MFASNDHNEDIHHPVSSHHCVARVMYTIQSSFGDIEDMSVCDLGCGPGVLAIGASLLGAGYVVLHRMLEIARERSDIIILFVTLLSTFHFQARGWGRH